MKLTPIPLVTGFYKDEDKDWSVQDCVNYLPTVTESGGTRTQMMLRTPPGLRPFVELPDAGPVRGVYNCEGRLFAVIGNTLYQISNKNIAIPRGQIPGNQRCQFAHNQATSTGANQLVIGNGQAGYVYNTRTEVFERITDPGFIGGISPVYSDSFILWVSVNRLYAQSSAPANALEYNTLDWFQSEFSPDKLVALEVSSSELIAFSESSFEFFQATGNTEQPFRTKGVTVNLGLAGRHCKAFSDNTIYFLASDGTFRRIDGYGATRISTGPVEQAIRGLDWSQSYSYVWEEGRYKIVYWTFPDGMTFGWDIANQVWHRRESYGLTRWRVSCITKWNGKNIAGDFQRGMLWEIDPDYILEGDQEFISMVTSPAIHGDGNLLKMPRLDVIMQTGQKTALATVAPPQPNPPTITGDAPDGSISQEYAGYTYTITPGDSPVIKVAIVSGSLPPGFTLNNDGTIPAATPTETGSWTFRIRVTDENGLYGELTDSISIAGVMFATLSSTPVNRIRVTGSPYDWSEESGLLSFSPSNCIIESYGGAVHVVGESGAAVSFDQGATWTDCTGLPSLTFVSILYLEGESGGVWIVVPQSGATAYKSSNGIAFESFVFSGSSTVNQSGALSFGAVGIISKGNSAQASRTIDAGINWSNTGLTASTQLYAIDINPETEVVLATAPQGSGPTYRIGRSTDLGGSWAYSASPAPGSQMLGLRYGNGVWMLITTSPFACWVSDTDTPFWREATPPPGAHGSIGEYNEFIFDGSNFVLATSTNIVTTRDGSEWVSRNPLVVRSFAAYRTGQRS